jgi:hypothetical protein
LPRPTAIKTRTRRDELLIPQFIAIMFIGWAVGCVLSGRPH